MSRQPPRSPRRRGDTDSDFEQFDIGTPEAELSLTDLGSSSTLLPDTRSREVALNRGLSYRHHDYIQAQNDLADRISNKFILQEETSLMVKHLERGLREDIVRTYVAGEPLAQPDDTAITLRVGITFLPGADVPQVTKLEQESMKGGAPDQKDSLWRVDTAGTLLSDFKVNRDLAVIKIDKTEQYSREAKKRADAGSSASMRRMNSPPPRSKYGGVNINSKYVKIVRNLREEQWDLEATLVEVDGHSLNALMANYRYLIAQGGPDMSFQEAKNLLEKMMEDARKFCLRSPILFRASTRAQIVNSRNTRYGVDHAEHYFQTLTTSEGIKETITLSASYFNSLDADPAVQKEIRPKFLQMITLLLSLLNDTDLGEIEDFLQSTYRIKSKRADLELLFLKVIPLMSINSKVFLDAIIQALEGIPLTDRSKEYPEWCWDTFLQRIVKNGYILPATVAQLGRCPKSWTSKYPTEGVKSSKVFNILQYGGNLRNFNEILPFEFQQDVHPTAEVAVIMTDGCRYMVGYGDVENITLFSPGAYDIVQVGAADGSDLQQSSRGVNRHYELEIEEQVLNKHNLEAIEIVNQGIAQFNSWTTSPPSRNSLQRAFRRRPSTELTLLDEAQGPGRLVRYVARLNQGVLAITYKFAGRKVRKNDAVRVIAQSSRYIEGIVGRLEIRFRDTERNLGPDDRNAFSQALMKVRSLLQQGSIDQRILADTVELSDEPIERVIYPGGLGPIDSSIWHDYVAWTNNTQLHIDAKSFWVSNVVWLSDQIIEVSLDQQIAKYFVEPLEPVPEAMRHDEVQVGDRAVLAGSYMIIGMRPDSVEMQGLFLMTNYLKIRNVEEPGQLSRRRQNRMPQMQETVLTIFA